MSDLLTTTLIKEQKKVTGFFFISRQENTEMSPDGSGVKAKIVVCKLFNWLPIYRSISLIQ